MFNHGKPKRWDEKTSCWDTEYRFILLAVQQDITEQDAKGILFSLAMEWFGDTKAQIINKILDLEDPQTKKIKENSIP